MDTSSVWFSFLNLLYTKYFLTKEYVRSLTFYFPDLLCTVYTLQYREVKPLFVIYSYLYIDFYNYMTKLVHDCFDIHICKRTAGTKRKGCPAQTLHRRIHRNMPASVQRHPFHLNNSSTDSLYSFRSITDTGQESLASIAVLSYSGATCAYASATPSSLNRNTSGHAATQAPHEIHPSFTTAFTGHSSLYFLGAPGRQSAGPYVPAGRHFSGNSPCLFRPFPFIQYSPLHKIYSNCTAAIYNPGFIIG